MEKYLTPLTPLLEDAAKMIENLANESPEIQAFVKEEYVEEIYRIVQIHLRDCTRCRFQGKVAYDKPKPKRLQTDADEVIEARPLNSDELGSLCKQAIDTVTVELDHFAEQKIAAFLDDLKLKTELSRPTPDELSYIKNFVKTHKMVTAANLREVLHERGKWLKLFEEKRPLVERVEEMERTVTTLRDFYKKTVLPLANEAGQRHAISNFEVYVIEPVAFVEMVDNKIAEMNSQFKETVVRVWEDSHKRMFEIDGTRWSDIPNLTLLGQDYLAKKNAPVQEPSLETPVAPVKGTIHSKNARSVSAATPTKPALKSSISASGRGALASRNPKKTMAIEKLSEEAEADLYGLKGYGIPLTQPSKSVREKPDGRFDQAIENDGYQLSIVRNEESSGVNVDVYVRIRPLVSHEKKSQHVLALQPLRDNATIHITQLSSGKPKTHEMIFSQVCDATVTQSQLFKRMYISKFVEKALEGFNCTCFAYGQTGSGKTYSMAGPIDVLGIQKNVKIVESIPLPPIARSVISEMLEKNLNLQGIMPQLANYLYEKVAELENSDPSVRFRIKATYVEIYNEKVQDLLTTVVSPLNVREHVDGTVGFYVEGVTQRECHTLPELLQVFVEGTQNRMVTAHEMNSESSRSHAILSILVEKMKMDDSTKKIWVKKGKICLVDLAGSESVKLTKTSGNALVETAGINKSLLSLSSVVSSLSEGNQDTITFRNSKLTMLLMDSLVGAGMTTMLACCSPSDHYLAETLSTLQFATKAANISKKTVTILSPHELELKKLKEYIEKLREENELFRSVLEEKGVKIPAA
eukprot:c21538_g1_i2.p1 GENE.c21538_g1_i2~~c21538_g1_i2.p1  ORF type:complete len:808 (-),score=357.60 c21538_g1_i2:10-2433(-)